MTAEVRRPRAPREADPTLGVDRHGEEAERVDGLLDRPGPIGRVGPPQGLVEPGPGRGGEGLTLEFEGLDQPTGLRGQGLGLHPLDHRQLIASGS